MYLKRKSPSHEFAPNDHVLEKGFNTGRLCIDSAFEERRFTLTKIMLDRVEKTERLAGSIEAIALKEAGAVTRRDELNNMT